MTRILITRTSVLAAGPCNDYPADLVHKLIPPEGLTIRAVAEAEQIPIADRVWALTRGLDVPTELRAEVDRELRLTACSCARRALALVADPDPRSVRAVAVAERYALGTATEEELREARAAARDAAVAAAWSAWSEPEAWSSDRSVAAVAAAWSAWSAPARAAWAAAAARSPEYRLTLNELMRRLSVI